MSNAVIQCEGLGKSYLIGHQSRNERYTALRDVMARQVRGIWQATRRALRGQTAVAGDEVEEFWALRDLSFDVAEGEVVGIIGRNGAGKSTLLKILSQITEPAEGRVTLRGRVASLLEVGTGFHPELTGRENIFLNGAILGMTRAEIKRKFDEIVAFAEVEQFLDTPVKRFSSGMYVRLAFAVAAHLEPEILLVDEVLAVGDAEFQKKCLGKMQDVSRGGRTVLFVSHNHGAIQTLCGRAILLNRGRMILDGRPSEVIQSYIARLSAGQFDNVFKPRQLSPSLTLERLSFSPNPVVSGEACEFNIQLHSTEPTQVRDLAVLIYSGLGTRVAVLDLRGADVEYRVAGGSSWGIVARIASLPLVEGDYLIGLYIHCGDVRSNVYDLHQLAVASAPQRQDIPPYPSSDRGFVELAYQVSDITQMESRHPQLEVCRNVGEESIGIEEGQTDRYLKWLAR